MIGVEPYAFGLCLILADILQPLDAHVCNFQQDATCDTRHVDAWLPGGAIIATAVIVASPCSLAVGTVDDMSRVVAPAEAHFANLGRRSIRLPINHVPMLIEVMADNAPCLSHP
ncbi:hypothetical protein BTW15_01550 [Pseudomonas syringae pv. tomato]|uniref:Secreted protein n=1 Tax=Pseudomonas syringae pv. tomato TaxID=323 RepID=A0AB36L3K0_PSEUB|nr:hypothetical protein BTW15_01550 [Pseudomonas syringae pv. tomato]